MKFSIFKNAWNIYFANFAKLFSFSLAIFVLFGSSTFIILSTTNVWLYIVGIAIFGFAFIPLMYSLQIVVARICAGRKVGYNEFYENYKTYFQPNNRGVYSILASLFLAFIVNIVAWAILSAIYEGIHPEVVEKIANIDVSGIEWMDSYLTILFEEKTYAYYFFASNMIAILFFMYSFSKNFMLSYFALTVGMPPMLTRLVNRKLIRQNKKFFYSTIMPSSLLFALAYIIGFVVSSILFMEIFIDKVFPDDSVVSVGFLVGLFHVVGLFVATFFLPPVLICHCFAADQLHPSYMTLCKKQMLSMSRSISNDDSLDEETKEEIDKMLSGLEQEVKQEENQQKENEKKEDDSSENKNK